MFIAISREKLTAFLSGNEDCEALSENEYVVDLYDMEPPVTMNLTLVKDGVDVEAAAELLYDEEQDGWYMGERIEDEARIAKILTEAVEA